MRYECIALSLGCSGFILTPHGLHSRPPVGFSCCSPMKESYRCTVNIITRRNCNEEILRRTLWLTTTRYHHPAFWLPSAIRIHPSIPCGVGPRSTGGLQSPPQLASLPFITITKYRILNVFTSLSPNLFFFYPSAWTTNHAGSLEHDVTHKQSECPVTGDAAPLVLIIPVHPLHRRHLTSISIGFLPCWRRTLQPSYPPNFSLAVLGAGKDWQRQWVRGVFSGDECQTSQEKPPSCSGHVRGLHIMKGTWGRQGKTERRLKRFRLNC